MPNFCRMGHAHPLTRLGIGPQGTRQKIELSQTKSKKAASGQSSEGNALECDVVVLGAGIVGISICRQLLRTSGGALKVAVIDSCEPACATGAGQGYIWLAHRQVKTPAWDLAKWSCSLWRESLSKDLRHAIEWQDTPSLLLSNGTFEAHQLQERSNMLQESGLSPTLLTSQELRDAEPALTVPDTMMGLMLSSDAQIVRNALMECPMAAKASCHEDGRKAAARLLSDCKAFDSFSMLCPKTVNSLETDSRGNVKSLLTACGTRLSARKGVVISAGAWTGSLLADSFGEDFWRSAFKPRKGHLLELDWPGCGPKLRNGLMELGYTKHYEAKPGAASSRKPEAEDMLAITFTATMSAAGTLLLGSSRQFTGFAGSRSAAVEEAILKRAGHYLPVVAQLQPNASKSRVGLRPYSQHGPIIGSVPGHGNCFIAGGHEGSGLTLAPATSHIITAMILGQPVPGFAASFSPSVLLCTAK